MKKVLFIIWSYSLGGGAEALLTTIVNHLNQRKYQVGIVEFYHSTIRKEAVNPNIKIYKPITFEGDRDYQKKLYYAYREPAKMAERYIPLDYDLYVSFNYQVPSFLLPEETRNIAWIHTSVYDLAIRGMEDYRCLQSKAFDKVAKIVSISDITTNSLQTLFPEHAHKIVEIYNAINIGEVREKANATTEIRLRHPAIIYVGRLDENKNPLRMVEIFNKIYSVENSAHLYFLGKGKLEAQVQEKADEYGLQNQVHFMGYLENPFPVIKQADISCITSKSEGFPMRLLESVALNVPFISTEIGGAAILSNYGECGRIYVTDEEAVKHVFQLLNMPKDLTAEKCEKSIRRFDLDVYISKIEHLFDEVLEEDITFRSKVVKELGNATEDEEPLEERNYYYRFPDNLIPKGEKVILYGAGDIGTNYYNYVKETGCCRIVAWVDAAAAQYRKLGKNVRDIEDIFNLEYDVILIAVMSESVSQSICTDLCKRGVPKEKVIWTRPMF